MTSNKKFQITAEHQKELLQILKTRFEKNRERHQNLDWLPVAAKLEKQPGKLWSLAEMEKSGGEPDVIGFDKNTDEYLFADCSVESPAGRRSLCFDDDALQSRKENKPRNSAINMASEMGVELLDEQQYRELQQLFKFDMKTSSWIKTPAEIRKLGGALFCDRRYNQVFVYHNGAESYYAARGFRGLLRV